MDEDFSLVEKAVLTATIFHRGQVDKAGMPYILHPLRVMERTRVALKLGSNELDAFVLAAAVLHDTVEDTGLTLDNIRRDFGTETANIVDHLTRRKGRANLTDGPDETYMQFIGRCAMHPIAKAIKLADIEDNLSRIEQLPPEERSIEHRYKKARAFLTN